MCAEYLRYTGWSVLEAADGAHAWHVVPQADVIVTGLCLGGAVDGTTLIARVRRDWRLRHLPIIVMTACVSPLDRQRAEAAGCDAFLSMPCSPELLVREIRRLLKARHLKTPRRVKAERQGAGHSGD
jgi:CheY-like chemotaxis protein